MTEAITNDAVSLDQQIINTVLDAWTIQNSRVSDFFSKHSDEVYFTEVAPGKNRAVYLLGHLLAVSDGLLPLLGLGERLYPELDEKYLKNPDRAFADADSITELREKWEIVNEKLAEKFNTLKPVEWLEKHTAVSAEDFALNPKRNRLTVLLSRITHQSYHFGQLVFLNKTN